MSHRSRERRSDAALQGAARPGNYDRLRWARWILSAFGLALLAMGTFMSGGWPILILGFLVVGGAPVLRGS